MSAMIMSKIKTSFSVWWCRVRGLLIGASELGLVDNFFSRNFFLADAERVFRGFTHFMVTENWKSPTALYQKSIRWSFHLNGATEDSQKGDLFYAGNWSSIKTPNFNSTKFVEFTTFMTTELNFYLSQYQCAADIWTWGAEIRFKPDLATKS